MRDIHHAIANGRTDRILDLLAAGVDPLAADADGNPPLVWAAYYGDVGMLRLLLQHGAMLSQLGPDLGLRAAAFHGHWSLCQFLLEQGAPINAADPDTGETPLHQALSNDDRQRYDLVVRVLLQAGADVHAVTLLDRPTGAFMRDARTRAETPLHRAAACGGIDTLRLLLDAGADPACKDGYGDTPLAWASWQRRPVELLRLLCYGEHRIHPQYQSLRAHLLGRPDTDS